MKYQPDQSIVDYNDWDLATSSVITGDFTTDSLKYGFGPTSLRAESDTRYGVAFLEHDPASSSNPKVSGTIHLEETGDGLKIDYEIRGLYDGLHGFHIHEYGDLTDGCTSACAHFNPDNTTHGGLTSDVRHMGDLGNISSKNRVSKGSLFLPKAKLDGSKYGVLGRMMIVHADEDDLGQGGNEESLKTGNAGKRLACGVIGLAEPPSKTFNSEAFDWLPAGNWVDLGYDNAPTAEELKSQIEAGDHDDSYGNLGCPNCGNVDLFWKKTTSKGKTFRCLSCEWSDNYETVKSQGDITLQKFGLTVDCPLCGETISAYNRASIDSHFRKHKKEAAEASEPKVSEAENEWQEEIEWNEKSKKKTEPEWEDVEWESETRRCCECHTTEGLTTIQAGTFCYDCLPINLGAEDIIYVSPNEEVYIDAKIEIIKNTGQKVARIDMFASPKGNGFGRAEFENFKDWAYKQGAAYIVVESVPESVNFWKWMGFIEPFGLVEPKDEFLAKHLELNTLIYLAESEAKGGQFAAEDDYDSTYGKAQAKIRRKLKNKIKKQAIMGTKAGQWSARKSQELKRQYEAACSKKGLQPYKGSKTKKQQDLSDWSKQKWKTASGKKSSTTGEPYFPAKAVAALKQKNLYAKAKRQKQAATKAGKQNARYSDDIRAVVKQYRAETFEDMPVPTQAVLNWIARPQIITKPVEFPLEPVRCIYCRSEDITTDGLDGDGEGTVTTDVTCQAEGCGAIWRDYFRYVDTEVLVPTSIVPPAAAAAAEGALHDEQLEIEIEGIDETYGLIPSDPEMLSFAESAVSQYQSRTDLPETFQLHTKPHFVFVSADAFGRSSHVARFRSQTASHIPIIMLSSDAIRESADQYGVPLETAVATTVWHELGHVLCELWDMEEIYPFDNSNQEEEFAESIAESMYFQEPFQNPVV
jgi:Cu-Zn family superoxide dismutase